MPSIASALLLSLAALLCPVSNGQAHVDTARAYVGTIEDGPNSGPHIKRFLASVGLGEGPPYCAAFVSFTLSAPTCQAEFPQIRSALASKFITARSIKASHALRGADVPVGSLVIWLRGRTIFGHIGIVLAWDGRCGTTLEANTSGTVFGDQREGDGVFIKQRCIEPNNYFRIVSFTPVIYDYSDPCFLVTDSPGTICPRQPE